MYYYWVWKGEQWSQNSDDSNKPVTAQSPFVLFSKGVSLPRWAPPAPSVHQPALSSTPHLPPTMNSCSERSLSASLAHHSGWWWRFHTELASGSTSGSWHQPSVCATDHNLWSVQTVPVHSLIHFSGPHLTKCGKPCQRPCQRQEKQHTLLSPCQHTPLISLERKGGWPGKTCSWQILACPKSLFLSLSGRAYSTAYWQQRVTQPQLFPDTGLCGFPLWKNAILMGPQTIMDIRVNYFF